MHDAGVTVLVDPWLVGQLTFGGLSWVYAGNKKGPKLDTKAIAAGADFMLITQARCSLSSLENGSQILSSAASVLGQSHRGIHCTDAAAQGLDCRDAIVPSTFASLSTVCV